MKGLGRLYAAMGLVAVGVVAGIVIIGNSSSHGVVIPTDQPKQPADQPTSLDLRGTYFELSYPATYGSVTNPGTDTNSLEHYLLLGAGSSQKKLAITIEALKDNGLADDSGYRYRSQASTYTHRNQSLAGSEQADIFTASDGTEETAYLVHADKAAVISFSTADQSQNMDDEMQQVLKSFKWR